MNFDFSDEQHELRSTARKFFTERVQFDDLRRRADASDAGDDELFDAALWRDMAKLGWLGAAIPDALGGAGLGALELCVLAEEFGRSIAPVPFVLSTCVVAEAIRRYGTKAQCERYLEPIARGDLIATFALAKGPTGSSTARSASVYSTATGHLKGAKLPVLDATRAGVALVACHADSSNGPVMLALVDLPQPGVTITPIQHFDPFRAQARVEFHDAVATPLGDALPDVAVLESILDQAAIYTAFEQVGGASACLDMACAYALERRVFARPIGSFQAIKHRLADMATKIELARSNAYFAAWALQQQNDGKASDIPGGMALAAATARVSASEAFDYAARENQQVHGGMGYTWEANCHPYYTRAKALSTWLGGNAYWSKRLIAALERDMQRAA